ncbi:hypothetical protein QR680_006887 [Steinernema hermaphroditum]|uniref:Uncharacterized protein n=1 Tax=Steinernema hermaphroditum TaxID=289476 RepID=A0AA39HWV5_9BILA|nr:hypothetical protein QR680_006887 [Steinernema hermaphroditum]
MLSRLVFLVCHLTVSLAQYYGYGYPSYYKYEHPSYSHYPGQYGSYGYSTYSGNLRGYGFGDNLARLWLLCNGGRICG